MVDHDQVIKTACALCLGCCGMDVHLEGGRVTRIEGMKEHPVNQGKLCPKGAAAKELLYSPDRLQYPMKREGDRWHRISWDEALDILALRLGETRERYGPRSLAVCLGFAFLAQGSPTVGLIRRFTDVYGTPNVFSVDSMCFRCRLIGYILTFGRWAIGDPERARCIVLWGHNPNESNPPFAWRISASRKKGANLIVIDPRRTFFAQKADIHVQPRPGSDCALALGMMNVIIAEGLYDREFVEQWTVGFDRLAEHVKQYAPEEVEKITWVPAEKIRQMARLFATTRPASIIQSWNALDQKSAGVQSARAIAILQAITGNFDVPGGLVTSPRIHTRSLGMPQMVEDKPLGVDKYPLHYQVFGTVFGEGQGMLLPQALLSGQPYPIKAMIVAASDLLVSWPNSSRTREALGKLDFLAVMDIFMSETAKLAHLVLPAATFLERTELPDLFTTTYSLPYVTLRKKVVQVGESWPDLDFWLALARRMGYQEYFPWQSPEEALDYIMEPTGLSLKRLTEEEPSGVFYGSMAYQQYRQRGLRTPSGKVELYSETLRSMGYDPLPTHLEPPESPLTTPETARDYPLILTTGARRVQYLHSQLRNIPRLRRSLAEPTAEINPVTAEKYGISNGQVVVVTTKRGSLEIKAEVTADIVAGVVNIPHGWAEANVNLLTDEQPADPIAGNPPLKALLGRVEGKT